MNHAEFFPGRSQQPGCTICRGWLSPHGRQLVLPYRGCKPEPPKFPSPQFQPRHERIEVDDLVWDANKGVVSRNPRKFCRKRSQAKFPAAETIRHGLSRMFWLCKPGISANGVPVP